MNHLEFTKIFAAISNDLARGPEDEYFLDGRCGLTATLAWAESAIGLIDSTENHELAFQYVKKCRVILELVRNHGWTVVTTRAAIEHAAVMLNQQWK